MADVADRIDKVLETLEIRLDKVKAAQGSMVRVTRAEIDLLLSLEEVRDLMLGVVRSGDREALKTIFGGDCSRSGRVIAVLDTVVLSPMNAQDQRLETCKRACAGVEGLLSDIGQAEDLAKAIVEQKAKLDGKKDKKAAAVGAEETEKKAAEEEAAAEKAAEEKAAATAAAEEALGTPLAAAEHKKEKSAEIKDSLKRGVGIIRDGFSFKYPTGADASRVEEATQGFEGLFDGVTKLAVEFSKEEEFNDHLGDYSADWANIIQYLYSMHEDPASKQYRGRINFCVGKLSVMSPEFLQALALKPDIMDTLLPMDVQADEFKDQKPGVVWVDYRANAYQGNKMLNNNPKLVLKGFCDDPRSKEYQRREEWLAYIIDRAFSPTARVACVICNKKHLRMFREITDFCHFMNIASPKFVIVTRESSYNAKEFTKLGIPLNMVTTDWNEAGKLAVDVIDSLSSVRI